jgi:RNA polymerase sigma-70 factor (ECF subfamily)
MGAVARKQRELVGSVVAQERPLLQACAAKEGVPASDVDDIVQDSVVRVLQRERLPSTREELTWLLLAIVTWWSLAANTDRARSREDLCAEAEDIEEYGGGPELDAIVIDRVLVRRALPLLSAAYRDVVERVYYQEESVGEVAEALGISQEAAKKRLTRALDELREIIDRLERGEVAAYARAAPLLALLALRESHPPPGADDAVVEPDTWAPGRPAPTNIPFTSPAGSPRAPARVPGPGGAGSTSMALAAFGIMAAAAAFILMGDVPLDPAVIARVETEIPASAVKITLAEPQPRSPLGPGAIPTASALARPPTHARGTPIKQDPLLKNDMLSGLRNNRAPASGRQRE